MGGLSERLDPGASHGASLGAQTLAIDLEELHGEAGRCGEEGRRG